jgi:hypothetical protein
MLSRPYAPFDLCNADVIYCSMYIQYSIYIFMSADPGIPPARGIPERARCMLPARHARSTPQQAGSARQGSARLGSTRLGRNGGPSASAQHLGPCSRTRRAHAHEAVPAPPPAGARTNARAPDPAVLPLCRHSLPRGRGVGEGARAMPIAKDMPPEGRGSRPSEGGGHDGVVRDGGGRNGHDGGGHNGCGLAGDGRDETITWRW